MTDDLGGMLLDAARRTGAELYFAERRSLEISAFRGQISEYTENRSSGAAARVVAGKRLGTACTERLDVPSLQAAARDASLNASCVDEDEGNALYDGEGRTFACQDAGGENEALSVDAKKRHALELEERCYALDPRVRNVISVGFGNELSVRAVANPRGLLKQGRGAYAYAYAYLTAEEGGHTSIGNWVQIRRRASSLDMEAVARRTVSDAVDLLGAGMPRSGTYRAVLANEAAGALFGAFIGAASAERIQKGRSFLAGKRGKRLGSGLFTVVDDPRAPGIAGLAEGDPTDWEAFDDEGLPCPRLEVFSQGTFAEPLYTLYSARREGAMPNGRGFRQAADSPVAAGTANAFIPAGKSTLEELMAAAGTGILITKVTGLHASLSLASGDFSASAKGFMIEGGRRGRPLENFTVAGNFLDIANSVEGVGDDLRDDIWAVVRSPSLLLSGIAVSGE